MQLVLMQGPRIPDLLTFYKTSIRLYYPRLDSHIGAIYLPISSGTYIDYSRLGIVSGLLREARANLTAISQQLRH